MELMEQAKLLRGPYQIAIDITNKCNYRCLHCYNASGENFIANDELDDDEFLDCIRDIAEIKPYNVCFCGGEPLLRWKLMTQSADILFQSGVRNIVTVTNGYYLTKEIAMELKRHHFNHVQVSLDGASKETCYDLRQHEAAFSKAYEALKILTDLKGLDPHIAFCPTKNNIDEFEKVYNLCRELGINKIRVQPLMIIGRASNNLQKILPDKLQYVKLLKKIKKLNLQNYKTNLQIEWGDPLDHIFRYKDYQHIYGVQANIKANGAIDVSPYLPITVGNVKKHKLSEYWDAGLYRVWALDVVQDVASKIDNVESMDSVLDNSKTWFDNDIYI